VRPHVELSDYAEFFRDHAELPPPCRLGLTSYLSGFLLSTHKISLRENYQNEGWMSFATLWNPQLIALAVVLLAGCAMSVVKVPFTTNLLHSLNTIGLKGVILDLMLALQSLPPHVRCPRTRVIRPQWPVSSECGNLLQQFPRRACSPSTEEVAWENAYYQTVYSSDNDPQTIDASPVGRPTYRPLSRRLGHLTREILRTHPTWREMWIPYSTLETLLH